METNQIVEEAKKIILDLRKCSRDDYGAFDGLYAKTKEFLRIYAGPKSEFYNGLDRAQSYNYPPTGASSVAETLGGFINYIEAGLSTERSPEWEAQLDVVSDFLDQANRLIEEKGVHPAVPAVIIGASLEEFLRTWTEVEDLSLGNRKPSIDAYASTLRSNELITKQDIKDITSWAGLRNNAAHGEWDKVNNKDYVRLVLEGVNLFMRKYGDVNVT